MVQCNANTNNVRVIDVGKDVLPGRGQVRLRAIAVRHCRQISSTSSIERWISGPKFFGRVSTMGNGTLLRLTYFSTIWLPTVWWVFVTALAAS